MSPRSASQGTVHHLPAEAVHCRWDRSMTPALEIEPGDTVVFETPEITRGQLNANSTSADLVNLDFGLIHQISGPVAIRGAEPGDSLVVDIVDIVPKSWAWSAVIPGFNLLAQDEAFQEPYLFIWDLSNGKSAEFKPGIVIPFEPFCGVMGVAPAEEGELTTIPPRRNGGNLDIRQLVKGTTLYLPVLAPGALFSCGDVHAAQGDGEVCGTGLECEATVTLRFNLLKGHEMPELAYRMSGAMTGSWNTAGWMGTTAHGPDLFAATQQAVRYMIDYLGRAHGLTPHEAFVLCSACVDMKVSEVVDAPNWIVSANLPLGIFQNG
ncbi:MAG: acetamidase/formamidase family protein [Thermomicrobiales bacterium]|nr:acetamidase/formamidase family protein [Thermomicrobiales bacterium]